LNIGKSLNSVRPTRQWPVFTFDRLGRYLDPLTPTLWPVSTQSLCHRMVSTPLRVRQVENPSTIWPLLRHTHFASALPPSFGSPSLATTAFSCFHPSHASAPPSLPLPLEPTLCPSHWPTKPGNAVHRPLLPPHEFTFNRRHPCTSSPTATSRMTTRAHSSSTLTPFSLVTSCLGCRHHPPLSPNTHHRLTALVSSLPFDPQKASPRHELAPQHHLVRISLVRLRSTLVDWAVCHTRFLC
jgi:hypothetical protein